MPIHLPMENAEAAYRALKEHGSPTEAARALGIARTTLNSRVEYYHRHSQDPVTLAAMDATGATMPPADFWAKTDKEGNVSFSARYKVEAGGLFLERLRETIQSEVKPAKGLPRRFKDKHGSLMVLDPADVHIGKLSVESETGFAYNSDVAEHRLIEGSRLLLEQGKVLGVTRVLFVIGNDIAHIDKPTRQTTSGTPQDTDGTIFTIYRVARNAYSQVVQMALEMGMTIDILFCPSNHDWVLGFAIAQEIAARFGHHPNVNATEYNVSEAHRKYYRFGSNLFLLTHGDGAKEADLPQIMLVEARGHIADCPHRYALLHHYHHRMKKALGVRPMSREKDHIAITVSAVGAGAQEGDNMDITYVRSPSAPDGWHHRNGYLNRQAVEAFIHHPEDGRKMVLTEWF